MTGLMDEVNDERARNAAQDLIRQRGGREGAVEWLQKHLEQNPPERHFWALVLRYAQASGRADSSS